MWGGGGDSDDRREGDSTNVTRSAAAGLPSMVPDSLPSHHSALLSPSLQVVLPSPDTQASHVSETDASDAGTVHRMGSDVSGCSAATVVLSYVPATVYSQSGDDGRCSSSGDSEGRVTMAKVVQSCVAATVLRSVSSESQSGSRPASGGDGHGRGGVAMEAEVMEWGREELKWRECGRGMEADPHDDRMMAAEGAGMVDVAGDARDGCIGDDHVWSRGSEMDNEECNGIANELS